MTGYIPVCGGNTVYLKNIVMPDAVTDRSNMAYIYISDKSWRGSNQITTALASGWNPVFDDEGNLTQFTLPDRYFNGDDTLDSGFIRLNAAQIDSTSVVTVNESIK